ncbi:MAG: hypothetical protein FJX52_04540, partial [Alphaproteobacteria bacterium]|nr:hypothetical protein [Alphaproteobacteria bacterium]
MGTDLGRAGCRRPAHRQADRVRAAQRRLWGANRKSVSLGHAAPAQRPWSGRVRRHLVRRRVFAPGPAYGAALAMAAPKMLDGDESRRLLAACGVTFAPWRSADSLAQVERAAADIGWPVALKTAAADVAHKSDAGCVALGLGGVEELRRAYAGVTANAARAGSATLA